MTRNVLITAFQPYDDWEANSSWLTLVELTRTLPEQPSVTTRLLPVDFDAAYEQLQRDLTANYDLAIHLGQAPGNSRVAVECVGLNVRGERHQSPGEFTQLVKDGVTAYHSQLPLQEWVDKFRTAGVPAEVSHHAGCYLCNASLYWTHHLASLHGYKTQAAFLHLPLETSQVVQLKKPMPSLPAKLMAAGIRLVLDEVAAEVA